MQLQLAWPAPFPCPNMLDKEDNQSTMKVDQEFVLIKVRCRS
jgi:hypothetical protein